MNTPHFPETSADINDVLFEQIAVKLEEQGYVVLPSALPADISEQLLQVLAHQDETDFHEANIGRGANQTLNPFVRRDRILWIEAQMTSAKVWLDWTEQLRCYLNRRLFMGLFSFESHFACYQPGDFYKKHLDAFKGQSNRVLSLVTYLNRGWEPDQGGELVIYSEDNAEEPLTKVLPAFGTLVIFLSEEFPHEVLAASRERFSVAGWFRINTTHMDNLDPPS